MLSYLRQLPFGVWAGFAIIGLGVWALDIWGVILGGILAVVTLITTDRTKEEPPGDDPTQDERFKDL